MFNISTFAWPGWKGMYSNCRLRFSASIHYCCYGYIKRFPVAMTLKTLKSQGWLGCHGIGLFGKQARDRDIGRQGSIILRCKNKMTPVCFPLFSFIHITASLTHILVTWHWCCTVHLFLQPLLNSFSNIWSRYYDQYHNIPLKPL